MDGTTIRVSPAVRVLGLTFDSKLTWMPHISDLVKKTKRALNVIRCLSNIKWGADRDVLLKLYSSLVLSKLDYGAVVYASARNFRLKILDPIHSAGLRMAIGAFRTSPIMSICCEAGIPPLKYRRDKLLLNYISKISSLPQHPVYSILFENNLLEAYESRPTITRPVAIRAKELMTRLGIVLPTVLPQGPCEIPPWTIITPSCRTDLNIYKKGETNNTLIKMSFYNILSEFPEALRIYTDGSKSDLGVGSAFSNIQENHSWCLPHVASIFTAELYAIWQALRFTEIFTASETLIISDSLSSIEALKNINSDNPLVQRILALITWLSSMGKAVHLIWCPSHIGIEGNEIVDEVARQEANEGIIEDIPIRYEDIKAITSQELRREWQIKWDRTEAKLKAIKPEVAKWVLPCKLTRREQVVLTRMRIGHTHLTSLYLLRGERQPRCPTCNQLLTVRHILLECDDTIQYRVSLGLPNTLEQFLGNEAIQIMKAIQFMKRSGLFYKI